MLAHIERWEPSLKATYALDPEGAGRRPRIRARWMKGEPLSAGGYTLDGVPATIKENIATRGVPVPLGTAATDLTPASADARRRRPACARQAPWCWAETTMPDYGMLSSGLSSFHELTRNPWTWARIPVVPAPAPARPPRPATARCIGTDIGGSVRLPAAWCGIATLKPSLGRIPIDRPSRAAALPP